MTDNDQAILEPLPQSVTLLSDLLAQLYPEPGPDILTLTDFRLRYRLTGMGPLAVGAIQQAQRINRGTGRFDEIGLCEFHIGLIYLDWNDYQGAIQQFRAARTQWSFTDKTAVICLTHLAEGQAHHHRYDYESALSQYGRAENCLKRIKFEPSSGNLNGFVAHLSDAIQAAQQIAREALWEPIPSMPIGETADTENGEVPSPPTHVPVGKTEETAVLPPINQQTLNQPTVPVPGHVNTNSNLVWYRIKVQKSDILFPGIRDHGWLLVSRQMNDHVFKEGDPIVIISNNPQAAIVLEPLGSENSISRPRICLARLEDEGDFTMENGVVRLSSDMRKVAVTRDDIFGYPVGLWLEAGEFEILEG
jgi:hypothetical protein